MHQTMYSETLVIVMDHWNLDNFEKTTIIVVSNITITVVISNIILS